MRSRISVRVAVALLAAGGGLLPLSPAEALPSFARQTGQECAACHNGFPELTPFGRLFKLNGYSFPGDAGSPLGDSGLPPVSAMLVASYTHTAAGQPGGAARSYGPNNNVAIDSANFFYGGPVLPHLGAFAQVTYNNIKKNLNWDNLDIRYADRLDLFGSETILGVAVNNNPGVTDVWNSTPVWGFPYQSSGLAPVPAAATMIEGGFAGLAVGLNAYAYWNQLVYAEFGLYRTLAKGADATLGVNPNGDDIQGVAPYWRLAIEPKWGNNSLEFGTFGLATSQIPGRVTGFGTNHFTDIGLDAQYQFLGMRDSVSVQARWITENQNRRASFAQGATSNSLDHLRSYSIKGTYFYEQTYGGTVQYFRKQGTSDPLLYTASASGSPDSSGWIFELNYFPFNHGGPSFWPWLNVRFGLQYTLYNRFNGGQANFDGNGRKAGDNDTLYFYSWFMF